MDGRKARDVGAFDAAPMIAVPEQRWQRRSRFLFIVGAAMASWLALIGLMVSLAR